MSVATSSDATLGRGLGAGWRPLIIQLVAILAALAVVGIYLATADLTATELETLTVGGLAGLLREHLALTFVSAVIVLVIAIPLGILLTRPGARRVTGPVLVLANFGQSAPAIGLIALLAVVITSGFGASIVALVLYALLPVLTNTIVGLAGVDSRLVEAGRGMGMSAVAVLFRVELPLAVPVILSGIRTALVLLVGTASLAVFVNGGGLGLLVVTGVNLSLTRVLIIGSLLIALLALLIDWLGRVVEHVARPRGL